MIYLDHNATTPPAAPVITALLSSLTYQWANSSSQHALGQDAKRLLSQCRTRVAQVLGCKPVEVVFTSGATEANHMAVRGLLAGADPLRRRVLFGSTEHAGHLRLAQALREAGWKVDLLPVLSDGRLNLDAVRALLGPDVALVSLMAANNETGVLMPTGEVAELAHANGALLHVDATQLIGKLPFHFGASGADAASLSAHKFYGPKGAGALLLRQGCAFVAPTPGSQERGRRGGTENLPGIVGMATALELLGDLPAEARRLCDLRDALETGLQQALPATRIWSQHCLRLPGTSYLRFGQLSVDVVLQRLERIGVAASSGAACSSGGSEPSHVLRAMGVAPDDALAAVRLSLGRSTTQTDVRHVLTQLPPLLAPLLQPQRAPLPITQPTNDTLWSQ